MAVEEAKYTVLREDGKFELRKYEPHILAETIVDEQFEEAGNFLKKNFEKFWFWLGGAAVFGWGGKAPPDPSP